MNKVYVVWRYHEHEKELDSIFAIHDGETVEHLKNRAKKYADEQTSAWIEDFSDDYFEVEGVETC